MFDARMDQLVYDFNCRPLSYVHESWLDESDRGVLARLRHSDDAQARNHLNLWLLRRFGLAGEHEFDFSARARRLLLLEPAVFEALARWVGLAGLAHVLRHWVDRERRGTLRAALGDEGFEFFLRQLLPWPAVTRIARADKLLEGAAAERLVDVAERLGATMLLSACGGADGAVARRAALKLRRCAVRARRGSAMAPARAERVVSFAVECVLRHREPTWQWLF